MIEYATNENGNTELMPIPGQVVQTQDPTKLDYSKAVTTNSSTWTAPGRGMVAIHSNLISSSWCEIAINNQKIWRFGMDADSGLTASTCNFPVAKGDKISITAYRVSSSRAITFIPFVVQYD